jgi:hypothetical protein
LIKGCGDFRRSDKKRGVKVMFKKAILGTVIWLILIAVMAFLQNT